MRAARSLLTFALLLPLTAVSSRGQEPPISPTLVHARTAQLIAEVIGTKSEKPSFKAEMNRILNAASETKLWTHFRYAPGSHADIILKILEDQTLVGSETITLSVFNPDDNEKLFSETRNLIDLDNDVSRLITHFLNQVQQERETVRKTEEEARQQARKTREEAELKAKQEREALRRVTCSSVELYANRADQRTVRKTLYENDIVSVMMSAQDEYIVKAGSDIGYVSSACLEEVDPSAADQTVEQEFGFVQVNSNPPGAKVFVDGISTKHLTPARIRLSLGVHTLVISLDGYQPASRRIQISRGNAVTVDHTLQPKMGNPKATTN